MEIDYFNLAKLFKQRFIKEQIKSKNVRIFTEFSTLLTEISLVEFYLSSTLPIDDITNKLLMLSGGHLLFFTFSLVSSFIKYEKNKGDNSVANSLMNSLRQSDEYHQCINVYEKYLDDFSSFLKSLDITDSFEVALAYQYMLNNGLLSYSKKHGYDTYIAAGKAADIIKKCELDELFGCRVATGRSVCRHMSSLLTDLENRVGNEAHNLYVNKYHTTNEKEVDLTTDYVNHQMTILNEQDKYYIYCPTCSESLYLKAIDSSISQNNYLMCKGSEKSLSVSSKITNIILSNDELEEDFINNLFNGNIQYLSEEELALNLFKKQIKIAYLTQHKSDEFNDFYLETKDKLDTINRIITHIQPLHELPKKLIIK